MYLDDLEINPHVEKKRTTFQKIVAFLEMAAVIFVWIGFYFQKEAWHYANDIIWVSFLSLSAVYLLLPIPLFRSQKGGEHLLVHFFGFFLAAFVIAIVVQIMPSEEAGRNPMKAILSQLAPFVGILWGASILIHYPDKATRNVYLRLGVRFLLACLLLF